jgi:hypothetical protein
MTSRELDRRGKRLATWAWQIGVLASGLLRLGAAALAVDCLLEATAKPLRALDALAFEGRREPLVALSHIPKCAI